MVVELGYARDQRAFGLIQNESRIRNDFITKYGFEEGVLEFRV